jgi:hypothetical protein
VPKHAAGSQPACFINLFIRGRGGAVIEPGERPVMTMFTSLRFHVRSKAHTHGICDSPPLDDVGCTLAHAEPPMRCWTIDAEGNPLSAQVSWCDGHSFPTRVLETWIRQEGGEEGGRERLMIL